MELADVKEFYLASGKLSARTGFIEPGILKTEVVGDADEHSSVEYAGYVTHLFESQGLKAMIVDASGGAGISPDAIKLLGQSDALKFIKKVGVYNIANPIFKASLELIVKTSGRDNIKVFNTESEAMAYLKEDADSQPT